MGPLQAGERVYAMSITDDEDGKLDPELFHQLYERMPQGIIYFNSQGRVVMTNPAAEKIMGMAPWEMREKVVGEQDLKIIREDGSRYPMTDYPPVIALRTGGEIKGVVLGFFNKREGRHRWISISALPIYRKKEKEPFLICATFEDVTEIVELKNELERALTKEKEATAVLQGALKPDVPIKVDGYQITVSDIPALDEWTIGGDIYDTFRTKDGKVGILIGDASGKGIVHASFAMLSRSTMRAFCYTSSSAAQSLTLANEVLCARQKEHYEYGTFITLCVLILDPATGRFQYSNAGHPPPGVWHSDHGVDFLPTGRLPLGLELCDYENFEDCILPGEMILLYTDGLSEARRNGNMFGEDGIERYLNEYASAAAERILNKMCATISAWTGNKSHDDITMILIERNSS